MRKRNALHAAALALGLFVVTASPSETQTFGALTLTSPNEDQYGGFGWAVAGAGDVDKDGFADVIVGASLEWPGHSGRNPGPDPGPGQAYIFSGRDGSVLFQLVSPNHEASGAFGGAVACAGDVNEDGFPDVIVGAPDEDPGIIFPDSGRAYIFSGQDGSLLYELVSPHEQPIGEFGNAVSGAGDVNQDGFADVIVGAFEEDPGGGAYIFSGRDGSLLHELVSPNEEQGGGFGTAVAGIGDTNQDGFGDVIVGSWGEDPGNSPRDAGRAYIFSGRDGSLLSQLVSPHEDAVGAFGHAVSGVGDLNQDGFADVVVGAFGEDPGSSPDAAGRAYVFSGQDGSVLFELVSPNEEQAGQFGWSVAGAGDVNQDGFADVIVGARREDPGASPQDAGRAYIFSGRDGSLLVELKSSNEEQTGLFGVFVAGAGDVNDDGLADVVVGAWNEDPGHSPLDAGRAYVFVPNLFAINSGGPNYSDAAGRLFVADQAYATGSFGFVGGSRRRFSSPIGGTLDDPLYQDLRVVLSGSFFYRFDVATAADYDVTLYLMAPALGGAGNIVMDVKAEGAVVLDDLDVTAEAGGTYQALVKSFAVTVNDGTLDLQFVAVNKAAVVSAIAVVQRPGTLSLSRETANGIP